MEDKDMKVEIRQEEACDFPAVYDINLKAFNRKEEARLADRLRLSDGFIPELSLVAIVENKIVEHIMFTKISIVDEGRSQDSLALAPMAVSPGLQRKGVGQQLIRYGLNKARELGYKSVVVLGHTEYYPRFGFVPTSKWGIKPPFNVPSSVFMAKELIDGGLSDVKGTVKYAREFGEL